MLEMYWMAPVPLLLWHAAQLVIPEAHSFPSRPSVILRTVPPRLLNLFTLRHISILLSSSSCLTWKCCQSEDIWTYSGLHQCLFVVKQQELKSICFSYLASCSQIMSFPLFFSVIMRASVSIHLEIYVELPPWFWYFGRIYVYSFTVVFLYHWCLSTLLLK